MVESLKMRDAAEGVDKIADRDGARRILVVDDDLDFADTICEILSTHGYEVKTANSTSSAREIIEVFDAKLALLDVRIGSGSGTQLIGELKKIQPQLLCVMMTAYAALDSALDALKRGAYDYLKKPIDGVDLLATVDRCFEMLRLSLQKERAEVALTRRNEELTFLNTRLRQMVHSAESLAGCLDLKSLGPLILKELAHLMAAEGGSMFVSRDHALHCLYSLEQRTLPSQIPLPPLPNSVLGKVCETLKPLLIENIGIETNVDSSGWPGYRDGSLLVFPLLDDKGDLDGIITLHNKMWPPFNHHDKELGQIMASLCSELMRSLKMTNALRESELRFRELAELLPEPCFEMTPAFDISWANQQACSKFGYESSELQGGINALELVDRELRSRIQDPMGQLLQPGGPAISSNETMALRKDGSLFPAIVRLARVVRDGNIVGFRGLVIDITQLKETELQLVAERAGLERMVEQRTKELKVSLNELERANRELHEANKHKSRFLSSMSHELRTPLNGILGFAELLKQQYFGGLNQKQLNYVEHIESSGKHLLALVNDLLDIVKIDTGSTSLNVSKFSPSELILATLTMLEAQAQKNGITVTYHVDPGIKTITADLRLCKQILLNLLSNALKYTPKSGVISLRFDCKSNDLIEVAVRDTGIGIGPEHRDKIFSEFYQADRVRDESLGGTGIGLALTRRLVELHGGTIHVNSEVGKGSEFVFTLPQVPFLALAGRTNGAIDSVPYEPDKKELAGKRILVAEDNDTNLAVILDILSMVGAETNIARNGQECVDHARKNRPDVILMDMRMPGMDGFSAAKMIRLDKEIHDVPIIAVTASADASTAESAVEAGCNACVTKPIQSGVLLRTMRDVIFAQVQRSPGTNS
jgi:PAS domain S-box-containing protein